MNKNNILKVLGIMFLLFIVVSWIIPAGYFNNGEYVGTTIMPIGLFDIVIYPFMTLTSSVFVLMALDILLIGALYGVLNKTGFYSSLLDKMVKKFKGKEKNVLIVTTIIFTTLSSLTGLNLVLVIFVPLFATLLMLLGYDKITAMLATIGGILVGNISSLYGSNIAGYITYLDSSVNANIIAKLILFIIGLVVLTLITVKSSSKLVKAKDIKLYTKTTKKVKLTKGISVLILMFVLLVVSMYNWSMTFNVDLFDKIHEAVIGFKIGNFPLFEYLIGSIPAFGHWTNYDLGFTLIIVTLLIGKLYKLSFKDIIDGAIEGIKEMLPVALMVVAANILFLLMNVNSEGYTFYNTMVSKTVGTSIAYLPFGIITAIGSLLFNDFPYLLSTLYGAFAPISSQYNLAFMLTQTIHGLVQLIVPTSVVLVIGLTYFDIPYTKWLKEIWKLLSILLVVSIIILIFI
ncbi:MAG: hypothetical protein J6G98_01245 [Bacilli bacterium]|nr:hypothetical protein [Bacilli bacterium]